MRIGEMRTKIRVAAPTHALVDGFWRDTYADVFPGPVWCKWANAHGAEVYSAQELGLREPATITMRYSQIVNVQCRIWHEGDTGDQSAYEIISMDNVGDRREFLQIKIQRVVKA